MDRPHHAVQKLFGLQTLWFARGVWKGLDTQAKEAQECCKQNLMGNFVVSSEDYNVDRNAYNGGQVQETATVTPTIMSSCLYATE